MSDVTQSCACTGEPCGQHVCPERYAEAMTRRPARERYRIPYAEAVTRRPAGACYCDMHDIDCYHAGHWAPVEFPDNGPSESF